MVLNNKGVDIEEKR